MKFKNFITDAISYAKNTSDDITSRLDETDNGDIDSNIQLR